MPLDSFPDGEAVRDTGLAIETRLLGEQVQLLFRHQPLSLAMLLALSGLAALFLGWTGQFEPGLLMVWFMYMALVIAGRAWLGYRYPGAGGLGPAETRPWLNRFRLGALLTGLGWGAASILFLPEASLETGMFLLLLLAGVGAGAVPVLSPHLSVFLIYIGTLFLPLIGILFYISGAIHTTFGLLATLFALLLARSAAVTRDALAEAFQARNARELALARVDEALNEARAANQQLLAEIGQRRLVEADLSRARVAAEAANRAKSQFLSNMSHELRTPMNGVLGMTELLLDTRLDDEQRDYLHTLQESAHRLHKTLSEVLDFVALDVEADHLELDQLTLEECGRMALSQVRGYAEGQGLQLGYRLAEGLPSQVRLDARKLQKVLAILLDNAVKFTPRGSVDLVFEGTDDPTDKQLHVSVTDTGIGIPQERLPELFTAFTQMDAGYSRSREGSGLGLALAARLAAIMGGRIWVESEPGRGSRFHVLVKYEAVDTEVVETDAVETE